MNVMKGEGTLLIPLDPVTGKPIEALIANIGNEGLLCKACKDLDKLGYRYITLPPITLHNLNEFRQLWIDHISSSMISNIRGKY